MKKETNTDTSKNNDNNTDDNKTLHTITNGNSTLSSQIIHYLENRIDNSHLSQDQKDVVSSFLFDSTGRVIVDSGAGTGKTTTLIDILANIVVIELASEPDSNPFEKILVLTFGRDAAKQFSTRLKRVLKQDYFNDTQLLHLLGLTPSKIDNVYRWLSTASNIQTIDSYFIDMLKEVALDIDLNPLFEIAPLLDIDTMKEEIITEIYENNNLKSVISGLEEVFPEDYYNDYNSYLFELVEKLHDKAREFAWKPSSYANILLNAVRSYYSDYEPPLSYDEIITIITNLTNKDNESDMLAYPQEKKDILKESMEQAYYQMVQGYENIARIAQEYSELYDEKIKSTGTLTFLDVCFLLYSYLEDKDSDLLRCHLRNQFDYILIDEFQDTSFVQCSILNQFVNNENKGKEQDNEAGDAKDSSFNSISTIGDVKQSIYEWRSAEPEIFADIISAAKNGQYSDLAFDIQQATHLPLKTNFRSKSDIIHLVNYLFKSIFDCDFRGNISNTNIEYIPLEPYRQSSCTEDTSSNIHLLLSTEKMKKKEMRETEALKVAQFINDALNGDIPLRIEDESAGADNSSSPYRNPLAGDFTLLFRYKKHIPLFAEKLNVYGIPYSVISDDTLFDQPEIQLMVDVMDWFSNPHNKFSLLHILRSPLISLSDQTLRYLSSKDFDLSTALDKLDDKLEKELNQTGDLDRLRALVRLRDDLRWDREGEKSVLIQKIVDHGALDVILLTSHDHPLERYGNIQLLVEIVKEWEEEDLLSYRKFVTKLKKLRERSLKNKKDYTVKKLGDFKSKERVKLMTIHKSKGLEFPVVIIPELFNADIIYSPSSRKIVLDREMGCYIKPFFVETSWDKNYEKDLHGPSDGRLFPKSFWSGGVFWLSRARDNGYFRFHSPVNNILKKEIAENWRILYVAMTRARDHLVLHLPVNRSSSETEWLMVFNEMIKEKLPESMPTQNFYGKEVQLEEDLKIKINFYVEPFKSHIPQKVSFKEMEIKEKEPPLPPVIDALNYANYSPITLSAKHIYDLISCPRRYAYSTLNLVDSSQLLQPYFKNLPPGANPPDGMSAAEWGTIVHRILERVHLSLNEQAEGEMERIKKEVLHEIEDETAKQRISQLIEDYITNPTIKSLYSQRKGEFFCELELHAGMDVGKENLSSIIVGNIDLFFQTESDEWILIDYKTGTPPPAASYLDRVYHYQMAAYKWLFTNNYPQYANVKTKVVYISSNIQLVEKDIDLKQFTKEVEKALLKNTKIIPKKGFDYLIEGKSCSTYGKCQTCPYYHKAGGPCN